mmetsp:Transcript_86290/g.258878  ORF Transcript_86290/g.258878 Transcript_86290/m.258878 type:complete len:211 (-) Transcript_86290:255-887(-)
MLSEVHRATNATKENSSLLLVASSVSSAPKECISRNGLQSSAQGVTWVKARWVVRYDAAAVPITTIVQTLTLLRANARRVHHSEASDAAPMPQCRASSWITATGATPPRRWRRGDASQMEIGAHAVAAPTRGTTAMPTAKRATRDRAASCAARIQSISTRSTSAATTVVTQPLGGWLHFPPLSPSSSFWSGAWRSSTGLASSSQRPRCTN